VVPCPTVIGVQGASASRLTSWVNDWSYLIEHNRVWNDTLFGR
jgi:hypothetical protein